MRPPLQLEPPLPCAPPWWARGGHAQTILGPILPSDAPVRTGASDPERREGPLSHGDRHVGVLAEPTGPASTPRTLVLLFHGLGGSVDSDYIRRTAALARARGHAVLAMNHRGCGAGAGLARAPYHSGRSADLAACLAFADEHFGPERRIVVGFSLSGNAALLQLAAGEEPLPDATIAVNPPSDLARAAHEISRGLNRIYDLRFVQQCRRAVAERARTGLIERAPSIPLLATLNQVDELVTAPFGGFADANDYYLRCSTHERLDSIEVPTVIVSAHDDPFVPGEVFEAVRSSSQVHVHLEPHGGHVGYLSADQTPLGTRRWIDYALDHYMVQLLDR